MTDNKITTEEKKLWIEAFRLVPIYKISEKRTIKLYKIMESMVLDHPLNHTAEDFSKIEEQLDNSFERTSRLLKKISNITNRLIEMNPDFRQN